MDRIPASERGKLPAPGTTLSRPRAAQSAEQGAERSMAGVQGARHCLLPRRLAGARPYVAGRHCGHPRHRLAVRADVLQDDFEACIAHCARYCTLKLVRPARLGLDHEAHRVCTPVGVSSIRASTIRAMAIMTNAVETNRILGSPLKLIYCTSFSHELY